MVGNFGRPVGSQTRATLTAMALLGGKSEALARKTIERVLQSDLSALVA